MIARWNGLQWDTMGTGIYGAGNVFTMARYNGELYVGGGFDSAGGKSARSIAKWNGTIWDTLLVQPFKKPTTYSLNSMAIINNELYISGTFDSVAGLQVNGIAKWNSSNWLGINFPNLQSFSAIGSIVKYNGEIYVAGNFNSAAYPNDTIGEIARYDGVNWKSVGGGINGSMADVESMVVYNGELYVAGYFLVANGNAGNYIQKWNGTKSSTGNAVVFDSFTNSTYVVGLTTSAGFPKRCPSPNAYCQPQYTGTGDGFISRFVTLNVGIEEHSNNLLLNIYPNPSLSASALTIELPDNYKGIFKLSLFNSIGGKVLEHSQKAPSKKIYIQLPELNTGIYLMSLQLDAKIYYQKLIVK